MSLRISEGLVVGPIGCDVKVLSWNLVGHSAVALDHKGRKIDKGQLDCLCGRWNPCVRSVLCRICWHHMIFQQKKGGICKHCLSQRRDSGMPLVAGQGCANQWQWNGKCHWLQPALGCHATLVASRCHECLRRQSHCWRQSRQQHHLALQCREPNESWICADTVCSRGSLVGG